MVAAMHNRQTRTLNMIRLVVARLRTSDRANRIASLPARLARLSALVDEINALGEAQTRPTQSVTLGRDAALTAMQDAALDIASAVALYATDEKLPELLHLVDVTPSDFHNTRFLQRPWLANRIVETAESVLPHLAPHVTAETLKQARALIAAADNAVVEPRHAIEAKSSATRRLAAVFREAKEALTQIDRLVFPLRRIDPDFYADYQAARRVIGLPSSDVSPAEAPIITASPPFPDRTEPVPSAPPASHENKITGPDLTTLQSVICTPGQDGGEAEHHVNRLYAEETAPPAHCVQPPLRFSNYYGTS
jgi:hypothetical protein